MASGMLASMPAPRLPAPDVDAMALGVAYWVWSRPPLDRSWVAQTLRGIKRAHGNARRATVGGVVQRNRTILRLCSDGMTQRDAARALDVTQDTVWRILRDRETWLSPDATRELLAAIWGPHNRPGAGAEKSLTVAYKK